MDSPFTGGRESSPAALYFSTNVAAAEPKLQTVKQPSADQKDADFLEAVRSGWISLDASLAMFTAGLSISQRNGSGSCQRHDQPATTQQDVGEQHRKPGSDAASVSTARAGETPFEMAALSSPFSSGSSTAGDSTASDSNMTPAMSEPQSSSEERCSTEQASAEAQPAVTPASGPRSAFKSPFEVVAESASPFGSIVPVPEDSSPAPAAASSGHQASACACRGPDGAAQSLQRELSSEKPSMHPSYDSQHGQRPCESSPSADSGCSEQLKQRPPSAASSKAGSSHAEGGYLSRQQLSARLSMLKKAQFTRLMSRSTATAFGAVECQNSMRDDVNTDDDSTSLNLASPRGAIRHHSEAAVMAAHRRRSVERRSSDLPRVLEAISEGGSKEACQKFPSDSTRRPRSPSRRP